MPGVSVPASLGDLPNDQALALLSASRRDTGHRRSPMGYRSLVAIVGAALLAAGPVAGSPAVGAAPPAIHGVVRLDQVGYAIGEAKRAFLLAEAPWARPGSRSWTAPGGPSSAAGSAGGPVAGTAATGRCTASTSAPCAGRVATGSWSTAWPPPHRRSGSRPATTCSGSLSMTPSGSSRSSATVPRSRGGSTAGPPT